MEFAGPTSVPRPWNKGNDIGIPIPAHGQRGFPYKRHCVFTNEQKVSAPGLWIFEQDHMQAGIQFNLAKGRRLVINP